MVSDYYARGRAIFADASSFAFFVLGFLGAAPFAWPALRASFELGAYDHGLTVFITRIFGSGLASGIIGYVVGALFGRLWQAVHLWRRAQRLPVAIAQHAAPALAEEVHAVEATAPEPRRTASAMSCRVGPLSESIYELFATRCAVSTAGRRYVETATTPIETIAAWDGLDVAGVARLLSDGHGAFFIIDIAVDPHYVAADVEQALIACAAQRVPKDGRLVRA